MSMKNSSNNMHKESIFVVQYALTYERYNQITDKTQYNLLSHYNLIDVKSI